MDQIYISKVVRVNTYVGIVKMNENRVGIEIYKIAKYMICLCLFYLFFYKYAISERRIILYATSISAVGLIFIDMLIDRTDISKVFSFDILINPIMCVYSIVIGLFVASNQTVLLNTLKTYGAFSLITLVIAYISDKEESVNWIFDAIIVVDIVSSLYVLIRGVYYEGYGNVLGTTQNPNNLGLVMCLGLFCVIFKLTQNKNAKIYYPILVLFLSIIIGTGSRKSLIAAIAICLIWLIPELVYSWGKSDANGKILILLGVVIGCIVIYYYYTRIYIHTYAYYRMNSLGSEDEGSSRNRLLYYAYALDYFLQRPFFGIGIGQFQVWNPLHGYSHSTYAEAIASWGLVGCTIYFVPVIKTGYRLIFEMFKGKDKRFYRVLLAYFVAELVLGLGQIWFYEIEHLIGWTLIFIYLKNVQDNEIVKEIKKYKYVKT